MANHKSNLIFGIHTISNILSSDYKNIKKIYFKKNHTSKNLINLYKSALELGIHTDEIELDQLTLLCESKRHQGVACELKNTNLSSFSLENYFNFTEKPFILVLDQIKDPNNLGACIRTANAVGCNLIIKRKSNSAPISPAVHKASCGGTSGLNIYETNDLNGIMKKLKKNNILIIGTDHKVKLDYREYSKTMHSGVCVIMGSEDLGISKGLKDICDVIYSIPIYGSVDCLNISVASGIILYEVAKYR